MRKGSANRKEAGNTILIERRLGRGQQGVKRIGDNGGRARESDSFQSKQIDKVRERKHNK